MTAPVLVLIESPFASHDPLERALFARYLRAAMRECLLRGEAPFASHALYTLPGVLEDDVPAEREIGIEAGLSWGVHAARTVVYADLGVSLGMWRGVERARRESRPVEWRKLDPDALRRLKEG